MDTSIREQCITITFSDVVENGPGMEKIGTQANMGPLFTPEYLEALHKKFQESSYIVDLSLPDNAVPARVSKPDKACLLVIKGFCLTDDDFAGSLLRELLSLEWDKKALFRGQVKNKVARYNLCFADFSQSSEYEKGKGTVVDFASLSHLRVLRDCVANNLLPSPSLLNAEGNLYYDTSKTYIGLHGDTERDFVIGVRLGYSQIPLHFRWFHKFKGVYQHQTVNLDHGDLYIMSYKATGYDWKKSSQCTLRHAAGQEKLIKKLRD